jgi:hypothetical protein
LNHRSILPDVPARNETLITAARIRGL